MITVIGNGHGAPSSNLDKAVYISHSANTFGNGMCPTVLQSVVGKYYGKMSSSTLEW